VTSPALDFSIVVPTRNRPVQLAACLSALAKQDYPRDRYEVVIVDDGSSPPAAAVASSFQDRIALALLYQQNAGPAAARNRGAAHARGTWLAFTDDDCLPDSTWLRSLATALADAEDCVVGGHTVNGLPENLCSAVSQLIIDAAYRRYNAQSENARFFTTNNLALGRALYARLGGLDEAFTTSEDRDLCDRCVAAGIRLRYAPGATVEHRHALSLPAFCRQHFAYGRGAFRFHQAQRARGSRQTDDQVPFLLDIRNWLLCSLTQVAPRRWPGLAALLVCWQLTNLAGFVAEGLACNGGDVHRSARR
jgi:GT2 family glycosyltransferase